MYDDRKYNILSRTILRHHHSIAHLCYCVTRKPQSQNVYFKIVGHYYVIYYVTISNHKKNLTRRSNSGC